MQAKLLRYAKSTRTDVSYTVITNTVLDKNQPEKEENTQLYIKHLNLNQNSALL